MSMADSADPQVLSTDESHLMRPVCPECSGSLAVITLPAISYYRCHVGHQWSPQSLVAAQADSAEANRGPPWRRWRNSLPCSDTGPPAPAGPSTAMRQRT